MRYIAADIIRALCSASADNLWMVQPGKRVERYLFKRPISFMMMIGGGPYLDVLLGKILDSNGSKVD